MYLHILNRGLESTKIAEANTQQTFVDMLDNDVIIPLRVLKVSQEYPTLAEILVLMIGKSGRNRQKRQENGSRKISKNPLLSMLIM